MEEDSGSSEKEHWKQVVYAQHVPKKNNHGTGVCLAYAQMNKLLPKSTERF